MTERRRRSIWTTATLTLGAFLVVLALLAWQLHAGEDPALGSGQTAQEPKQRVVIRRIVKRVVVTRVVPAPTPSTPAASPAPAPAVSAPAAAVSAPAPAPAAPAPAPAVTRTS